MHGYTAQSNEDHAARLDTTRANIARVYDVCLNGKDNFEADRDVYRQMTRVAPEVSQLAWDNRRFLMRATRFLAAKAGITQFLDCGSGLPTAENTHQVAQRHRPEANVVYVDDDPVVLAHGRALLAENELTRFADADIFAPRSVIENEVVRSALDFSEPIALLQCATLVHCTDERDPGEIMREYVEALPAGSYVVLTHFHDPGAGEHSALAKRLEQVLVHSPMGSGRFRTRAQIESMLPGLELLDPGLVRVADWWPDGPRTAELPSMSHCILGAVGRKE
ncbi:SAM-dependent methyltransferase [Parasphingorhabdus pacifica]